MPELWLREPKQQDSSADDGEIDEGGGRGDERFKGGKGEVLHRRRRLVGSLLTRHHSVWGGGGPSNSRRRVEHNDHGAEDGDDDSEKVPEVEALLASREALISTSELAARQLGALALGAPLARGRRWRRWR